MSDTAFLSLHSIFLKELEKYEQLPEDVGHCFVTWVTNLNSSPTVDVSRGTSWSLCPISGLRIAVTASLSWDQVLQKAPRVVL